MRILVGGLAAYEGEQAFSIDLLAEIGRGLSFGEKICRINAVRMIEIENGEIAWLPFRNFLSDSEGVADLMHMA